LDDPGQSEHIRVLGASFGEKYAIREHLDSRFCCLHLLPGKALEMLTRKFQTDEQGART
jgi:hypothetical protein